MTVVPRTFAGGAVLAGVAVAAMITGLAAAHDTVPQTLDFLATALVAGGVGVAVPNSSNTPPTP